MIKQITEKRGGEVGGISGGEEEETRLQKKFNYHNEKYDVHFS